MDYSVFDSLIDSVIVINDQKQIVYSNIAAATLLNSSQRRLSKKPYIYNLMSFSDDSLFVAEKGTWGMENPTPYTEVDFELKSGKEGKVQVAIQPFKDKDESRWIIMLRDVTLEEVLHGKYRAELEQKEEVILELKKAQGKLEAYSKNLEKMVEERTAEVRQANSLLNAIMNSLGQGFLVFDQNGVCMDVYTRACEQVLETVPAGRQIWDVLKLSGSSKEQFEKWTQIAFQETLPFGSVKELAPGLFDHSEGRYVVLDYYPIRNEQNKILKIVLVATDMTKEHQANSALEKERQYARMIIKLVKNKDQFTQFIQSSKERIRDVQRLLQVKDPGQFDLGQAFRILHTLEGEAGAFSASAIRLQARESQNILQEAKGNSQFLDDSLIEAMRESMDKLSQSYKDFLQENQDIFSVLSVEGEKSYELPLEQIKSFARVLQENHVDEKILAKYETSFLWQPAIRYLRHFDDVMNVIATREDKLIKPIIFRDEGVLVDPERFEAFFDVLVHVFRNAVDHGIELPRERCEKNKTEAGRITVKLKKTYQDSRCYVQFQIEDDGRGIDPQLVRKRMQELQPERNLEGYSDEQLIQLIFEPGFSSREQVGEFSGRGIGMDAVKEEVQKLGGRVRVESAVDVGTKVIIEVPLVEDGVSLPLSA